MTLPRQHTTSASSKQLPPVTRPHKSRRDLEKEVAEKVSKVKEQLKETEERISSGEMDLYDLAD